MKAIGFVPALIPLILSGSKILTYRLGTDYDYLKPGDTINTRDNSNDKVFAKLKIIDKYWTEFKKLPIDIKGHEKYKSKKDQREILEGYYKRPISDNEKVLVLKFEVIEKYVN